MPNDPSNPSDDDGPPSEERVRRARGIGDASLASRRKIQANLSTEPESFSSSDGSDPAPDSDLDTRQPYTGVSHITATSCR